REIVVENCTTLQVETRRILDASLGIIAVGEEISQSLASSEPVAIKAGDREDVGNVDLIDESLRLARQLGEKSDALGIDRRLRLVGIHCSLHAADEISLQVRIFPAQHGLGA